MQPVRATQWRARGMNPRRGGLRVVATVALLVALVLGCSSTPAPPENQPAAADNVPSLAENTAPVRPAQPASLQDDPAFPTGASHAGNGVSVFTDGDEAFAARCHEICTQLLHHLRDTFPARGEPPELRILVFGSRDRYREWADEHAPENADVSGYHDPVTHEVVATDTQDDDALVATMAHELTHAVLRDHLGTRYLPPWLDEGMASVYETAHLEDDGSVTFGQIHRTYAKMVAARLHADGRLDLRRLATLGYELFANRDRQRMLDNYAVSWSLLWYIIHGERGLYHGMLRLYLTEVAAVTDRSTAYVSAYDTVVGPRAAALLAGWRIWAESYNED